MMDDFNYHFFKIVHEVNYLHFISFIHSIMIHIVEIFAHGNFKRIFHQMHIAGLVVNCGISNTVVLEIPWFTTKTAI